MFEIAERKAVEAGLVQSGDDIVIVAGVPVGELFVQKQCVSAQYVNLTLKTYHYEKLE